MEEIPKDILNAIDSFNVESDEEFFWIWIVLCLIMQASIESYV
jgi:hypothetical protein